MNNLLRYGDHPGVATQTLSRFSGCRLLYWSSHVRCSVQLCRMLSLQLVTSISSVLQNNSACQVDRSPQINTPIHGETDTSTNPPKRLYTGVVPWCLFVTH